MSGTCLNSEGRVSAYPVKVTAQRQGYGGVERSGPLGDTIFLEMLESYHHLKRPGKFSGELLEANYRV